jgi:hypothetical protein
MTNIGTHVEHCCVLHGCKYGHADCPVAACEAVQAYPCERCDLWEPGESYEFQIEYYKESLQKWVQLASAGSLPECVFKYREFVRILNISHQPLRMVFRQISSWEQFGPTSEEKR